MNASISSPARWLPLALVLVATASWAMSTDLHSAAPTSANDSGAILPYGAASHAAKVAGTSVLPYGAMSANRANAREAILPYGAMSHAKIVPAATILPYGAMGPRVAP
ncbi:hypothetical protein [Luteibacter aegosomatissinici]|uniref:hypothetical protein n=1 Tax=Luteibacter aegosomatissinici TaxID=2911539 RepID=UPI001FFB0201|nr:hypothetical protein [Luteibacter aegosomatissinici]UPG92607.1 hypothetical protein L2Y97_12075 [Luteibacter aegosomatissinici]